MKSVQIPYALFVALLQYHLAMEDDYAEDIRRGLEEKLDAMVRHELYAKYKTAPTEEEREQARQEYLDRRAGELPLVNFPLSVIDRGVTRSCEWLIREKGEAAARRNRTGVERDCCRQQSPRQGAKPVENA